MSAIESSQIRETTNHSTLNEREADCLFKLYRNYHMGEGRGGSFYANEFQSAQVCDYSWKKLDVDLPIEAIEKIAEDSGVIQLRPINPNDKVLIIGCGNKPLSDETGNPATEFPLDEDEIKDYYDTHTHNGAVTIDPHLAKNPTIVANFGQHKFPMLKDGQFDLVVIEGLVLGYTDLGSQELQRLVSKTGQIVQVWHSDNIGREFSWDCQQDILPEPVINLSNHPSFSIQKEGK